MNDFRGVLIEALGILGCDADQFGGFDTHSTVAMTFDEVGDVLLEGIDDQVWIWNDLGEGDVESQGSNALDLLIELTRAAPYSAPGQLQLAAESGRLILKTILLTRCTEDAGFFAAAIEDFFGRAKTMRELIR